MTTDIRDKPSLRHDDIMELNFIRSPGGYFYRRHYRAGLRSHIMEVLKREDWEQEEKGVIRDKLMWFPRAKPLKMLRLFRTRFNNRDDAEEELRRVKVILSYLVNGFGFSPCVTTRTRPLPTYPKGQLI